MNSNVGPVKSSRVWERATPGSPKQDEGGHVRKRALVLIAGAALYAAGGASAGHGDTVVTDTQNFHGSFT